MCLETYQIKDPFNVIGPGTMCHNGYFHVDSDKQDVFATHHSSAAGGQHKQNQRGSLDNYNSNDISFSDFVPDKKIRSCSTLQDISYYSVSSWLTPSIIAAAASNRLTE